MNQVFTIHKGKDCTYSAPACEVVYLHLEKNLVQTVKPGTWYEDPDEIG